MQISSDEPYMSRLMANLPTVFGVIVMFIIATLYFTAPGWAPAVYIRNSITLSMPFPTIVVSLLLIRKHIYNVLRKAESLPYDIVVLVMAAIMVVLGLTGGVGDRTYNLLNENINIIGTMSITSAIAISVFSPMIRIYRAKTPTMTFLIALSCLAFATYTPLGQMISPVIPQLGDFVQTYVAGASDSAFWISTYVGALALITRMVLLKEKLKPS
jgi:hypothetical protein